MFMVLLATTRELPPLDLSVVSSSQTRFFKNIAYIKKKRFLIPKKTKYGISENKNSVCERLNKRKQASADFNICIRKCNLYKKIKRK